MRRLLVLALGLALLPAIQPADAATSLEPEIQDPFGDANGISWSGEASTYPASYSPADLISVDFQTGYVAVPVGEDGIDYQPSELRLVIRTFASPGELAPGTQLLFEVPGDDVVFDATLSRAPTGEVTSTVRLRYEDEDCDDETPCWTRTNTAWTAVINSAQKTLTLTYPFSSLAADEYSLIRPGATLFPEATVGPPVDVSTGSVRRIDSVAFGDVFAVGEDVPEDVNCTKECQTVRFGCAGSGLLGTGGGYVDFRASGFGGCFTTPIEHTDLTLSIERCVPSGCTTTTSQKSCLGAKCGGKMSVPDALTERAGYEVRAVWDFGHGRSFTMGIGLCPSLADNCPESAEKHVQF